MKNNWGEKYHIGQTVRLSPKITGGEWQTAVIDLIAKIEEGDHLRFEYGVTVGEKYYHNCREELIEPKFLISSIL